MPKNALVVVDVQNDFLPGGALGVREGDQIIPCINRLVCLPFDVCVASQDYHPEHHISFASRWGKKPGEHAVVNGVDQTLWPDHCVQGTKGVEFSPQLDTTHFELVAHKGVDPEVDSYSIFFDSKKHLATGLDSFLQKKGITDIYFAGLATEYCVFYSVVDSVHLGFQPHVIIDACRGIDLNPGDIEKAIRKMQDLGAKIVTTEEVIKKFSNEF